MSNPTIKKRPATEFSSESAQVAVVLPSGQAVEIDVYGPDRAFGKDRAARVNWPGIGAVERLDAIAFAEALYAAAEVASSLTGPAVRL